MGTGSSAVGREAVAGSAGMAGAELAMIHAATDHRSFADHLRWNNAYYRLAQRL